MAWRALSFTLVKERLLRLASRSSGSELGAVPEAHHAGNEPEYRRFLRSRTLVSVLTILVLASLTWLSLRALSLPSATGFDQPADQFSSARALQHVDAIAQRPHPVGSAENARVRDYVMAQVAELGLRAEIQRTLATIPEFGRAALIENVLVRLPGSDSTRAVLISAHYDSVESASGAGDDGVGVAAMLEALRALGARDRLRNDVIFLFTDGEEAGIFGANAFVAEHPWAKDIGVAFTFDGSSGRGPLALEKTGPADGWLVREIAAADLGALVKSSSNDTDRDEYFNNDFGAFQRAGYTGGHFDDLNGTTDYHNRLDSLERLDERKLQNYGSAMLRLAEHFGNLSIDDTREGDHVFFNLYGKSVMHYPNTWTWPMTALATLLVIGVLWVGLVRNRLTPGAVLKSALVLLLFFVVTVAVAALTWEFILSLHPEVETQTEEDIYQSPLLMGGIVLLAVAGFLAFSSWCVRRFGVANLHAAVLILLAAFALAAATVVPLATYLVLWPLLASAGAAAVVLFLPKADAAEVSWPRTIVLWLAAVPAVGIIVPGISDAAIGPEQGAALVVAALVAMLALLVPQLDLCRAGNRYWLPGLAVLCGIVLLAVGSARSGFSADQPRPHSLFYVLDEEGTARFATADDKPDAWIAQFVPATTRERQSARGLLGIGGDASVWSSAAPLVDLLPPELALLNDRTDGDLRTLRMRVVSPRHARRVYVVPEEQHIVAAAVDGKPLDIYDGWLFDFVGFPEDGVELEIAIKDDGPARFTVLDQSDGLPEGLPSTFDPEPPDMMPSPLPRWARGYPTFVRSTYVLE